jgi:hypothetical protein
METRSGETRSGRCRPSDSIREFQHLQLAYLEPALPVILFVVKVVQRIVVTSAMRCVSHRGHAGILERKGAVIAILAEDRYCNSPTCRRTTCGNLRQKDGYAGRSQVLHWKLTRLLHYLS